jgi:hypothetical protein
MTIVSRHISSDSVSGITRAYSHILGGAQTPRGSHLELQRSDLQSDSYQDDPDLCRNTMKYRNTHKRRDAAEIRLHFINNK